MVVTIPLKTLSKKMSEKGDFTKSKEGDLKGEI